MTMTFEGGSKEVLRDHLQAAEDARLQRVVAVVDALAERGEADLLIAPLRPRLAQLRPPRPISLTRLLFEPVAPLIVAAGAWRPGSPGIPRPALAVVGNDLRAAFGPEAAALQARYARHNMDDAAAVADCGAQLWPRAAALLRERGVPAGWAATGLPDSAHAAIVPPMCSLLAEGSALRVLSALPRAAAAAEAERLLRHAGAGGPAALAMMLALLLGRWPGSQQLLRFADHVAVEAKHAAVPTATDRALAFVLGDLGGAVGAGLALPQAADEVRRTARMLEELQAAAGAMALPTRIEQVTRARKQLAELCRERMATAVATLTPPAERGAEPVGLAAMEETARDVRKLDSIGRRLDGEEQYDRVLSAAASRLAGDRRLPLSTRIRLAEILVGPDAALAMLPVV